MAQNSQTNLTGQEANQVHALLSARHADVDLTDTPADGDVITWREQSGKFVLSAPAGGLTGWETDEDGNLVATGTGQVLAPDGTYAAPSYSFVTSPNTGLKLIDVDTLGVVVHGEAIFQVLWFGADTYESQLDGDLYVGGLLQAGQYVKAGGQFQGSNGTAAAPSYAFTFDLNSGMYRIADNVIGFSTNSAERWRINDTGQLIPTLENVVAAEATDAASTQTLANSLRTVLLALGILDAV